MAVRSPGFAPFVVGASADILIDWGCSIKCVHVEVLESSQCQE
jgi:hypothetical protein